jgi:hypothetical protein
VDKETRTSEASHNHISSKTAEQLIPERYVVQFSVPLEYIIIIIGMTTLCEAWPSSGFLNNLIFTV